MGRETWLTTIHGAAESEMTEHTCTRCQLAFKGFSVAQMVKNPPAMQETQVQSLGQEDSQEKGIATHISILA